MRRPSNGVFLLLDNSLSALHTHGALGSIKMMSAGAPSPRWPLCRPSRAAGLIVSAASEVGCGGGKV